MGVFIFVMLALFSVGSFSLQLSPKYHNEQPENDLFSSSGKKWVVLVASSSGWENYRHQADICHAYQIMIRNGIPKENIITMMVDDIAYNSWNPTPGIIINQPNGTNVYEGVEIDYKGDNVTSENFLNIIKGNKLAMASIGSGKVVEGGYRDTVFINFVDHGSTGILSFPDNYLYADQLNDALKTMSKKKIFKKALLYIESCFAGSMFDGIISENKNILAITASGPRENSHSTYCNYQSIPYYTCLGDLFSVTWMENLDSTIYDLSAIKRTMFNYYKKIRTNVTESNIMLYGDFNIGHEKLSTFIGYKKNDNKMPISLTMKNERKISLSNREATSIQYILYNNKEINNYKKHELETKLFINNEMRLIIDDLLREIYLIVLEIRPDIKDKIGEFDKPKNLQLSLSMFPCYRTIINKITETYFSMPRNPYVLDRLKIFANLCIIDNQIHELVANVIHQSNLNIPKNIINVF